MKSMNKGMVWHYVLINLVTGVFFYGQTEEHRKELRHKDREYTKLIASWQVQGHDYDDIWFEIPKEGTHLDKLIHPKIDVLSIVKPNPNRGNNECFILVNGIKDKDILIKEVENLVWKQFKGKKERIQLNLRYPQRIFRDKVNHAFSQGFKSMLLCALMRTGKVVMCNQAIVDHKFKVSLAISRIKSPEQSWQEDTENFDAFANIEYIRMGNNKWKEKVEESLLKGRQVLLFTTAQYLINKLHLFYDIDVDLLIFDEVHVGGKAEEISNIRRYFDQSYMIDVSGTAFDYIEQYGDTNRFVWTYYNNVKYCVENNLPYSKINLSVAKYDTEFKQYHPDAPDSITNLFDLNDDKDDFRYPSLVMSFINEHLIVGKNPKLLASQYTLCNSKHIYCALPSIKACDLICEYIKKSDCIYEPMSCHGDSKKGFEQINAHLERYSHTICFTVSANVLGVTAPWDTVMFLSTGESVSQFLQMALRASSNPEKDALVIDFAAERGLKIMRDYDLLTYSSSNSGEQLLSDVSYLDCFNTLGYNTGFEPLDITEIDKMMALDIKDVSKICASVPINNEKLSQFDFDNVDYQKNGHRPYEYYEVNSNNTDQSKAKQVSKNATKRQIENELKKKRETILVFLTRFSKVVLMEQLDDNRVETIDTLLSSEYFQETVDVHPNVIRDMVDQGILNKNIMNSRISDVNSCVAKNLENNVIEALTSVSNCDGVNRPIPEECFYAMMNGTSVK
jgi:hypothetical protein|tara:strand:+ start:191 stop:2392 length:2202 start_codon:yes stop_codon:yes gene_type:complete